jgi:hypothetical protein
MQAQGGVCMRPKIGSGGKEKAFGVRRSYDETVCLAEHVALPKTFFLKKCETFAVNKLFERLVERLRVVWGLR